jgi:3-oxoacyl-[acyl-carrier-protein] synthase-3
VLHILGIGTAYPETVLTNELLVELSGGGLTRETIQSTGIARRHSVLPVDYLLATGNADAKAGEGVMLCSPTDLALRATESALSRAGLAADQIGLIWGDACSPVETTPSEAQRLGARLNIKANAYDVVTGGNGLLLHLDLLDGLTPEKLPDVIVCVSANTPTQQVNYRTGVGAPYLSDGATAVVLSPRIRGKMTLDAVSYAVDSVDALMAFDTYGHVRFDGPKLSEYMGKKGALAFEQLVSTKTLRCDNLAVIPPQFDNASSATVVSGGGVSGHRVWSNFDTRGYTVGAATFSVLADRWDTLQGSDRIALIGVGGGSNFGHALFHVNERLA